MRERRLGERADLALGVAGGRQANLTDSPVLVGTGVKEKGGKDRGRTGETWEIMATT